MLRIQRSSDGGFSLSGRIEPDGIEELQRLLSLEEAGRHIALDLGDVMLIDRDGVKFLAQCEADGMSLEHCPAYIREWIDAETGRNNR